MINKNLLLKNNTLNIYKYYDKNTNETIQKLFIKFEEKNFFIQPTKIGCSVLWIKKKNNFICY